MSLNALYTNGMPGHDWDILETELNDAVIDQIEQDIIKTIAYLAEDSRQVADNWLFKSGGLVMLTEETSDLAEQWRDKMTASGSWIMMITAELVTLIRLKLLAITLSALGSDEKDKELERDYLPFSKLLTKREYRPAQNAREDAFISILILSLPSFYEFSADGMDAFKMTTAGEALPAEEAIEIEAWKQKLVQKAALKKKKKELEVQKKECEEKLSSVHKEIDEAEVALEKLADAKKSKKGNIFVFLALGVALLIGGYVYLMQNEPYLIAMGIVEGLVFIIPFIILKIVFHKRYHRNLAKAQENAAGAQERLNELNPQTTALLKKLEKIEAELKEVEKEEKKFLHE